MLHKGKREKTINDCIRATAKKAKKRDDGRLIFVCEGLDCDKCPFTKCSDSMYFHTVQDWIEILQEKGVHVDPALVAEYCKVADKPTVLTDTINYLTQQYKYIEETIEDEILRDHSIKYLNKASVAIHNALKYISTADSMLRKQRGE